MSIIKFNILYGFGCVNIDKWHSIHQSFPRQNFLLYGKCVDYASVTAFTAYNNYTIDNDIAVVMCHSNNSLQVHTTDNKKPLAASLCLELATALMVILRLISKMLCATRHVSQRRLHTLPYTIYRVIFKWLNFQKYLQKPVNQ